MIKKKYIKYDQIKTLNNPQDKKLDDFSPRTKN